MPHLVQPAPQLPLTGHLTELRRTLLICIIPLLAACTAGTALSGTLLEWIFHPPLAAGAPLYLYSLADAALLRVRVGGMAGVVCTAPLGAVSLYRFARPGLTSLEAGFARRVFLACGASFSVGAVATFYYFAPAIVKWWWAATASAALLSAEHYLTMWEQACLASGLLAMLPVAGIAIWRLMKQKDITRGSIE